MGSDPLPGSFEAGLVEAVAHPIRVLVLQELYRGPLTLAALSQALEVPPSTLARHTAELLSHRLIEVRGHGLRDEFQLVEPRVAQARHALHELAHRLPHSARPRRARPLRSGAVHGEGHAHAY